MTTDPKHDSILKECQKLYTHATHLVRLPGSIPIPSFLNRPQKIIDVSLVVRQAKQSPARIRQQLDIPTDAKCVLITFGGFDLQGTDFELWTKDRLPTDWFGIVACPKSTYLSTDRLRFLKSEDWYMPGMFFNVSQKRCHQCG